MRIKTGVKSRKQQTLAEMIEAERSCVVGFGTEFDMLSDSELAHYLDLSIGGITSYRGKQHIKCPKSRLKAYRKEREASE